MHRKPALTGLAATVRTLALLCAVTLLVACGGGDRTSYLSTLAQEANILAFGDSLTFGTGATAEQSYPAVLAGLVNRNVIRAGVPGETTTEGLRRLPGVLDKHEPDLVLLCLGGNDMLRKGSLSRVKDNLAEMITLVRERGIPVVLIGVPEPALVGLEAPALYSELAEQFDLPLENTVMAETLAKAKWRSDRIHPNAEGYQKIAEALADLLKKAGAV